MTLKITMKILALLGSTMLAEPALADRLSQGERSAIRDAAMAELRSLGFSRSDFESVKITVENNKIEFDADGDDVDVDLTFARNGNTLGGLIEGDVDSDDGRDRVFSGGGWIDDDDDTYDDDDDRSDRDDRSGDDNDGDDDSDDDGDDDE
ncbi:MAG: hypothetical protein AAF771_17065 [Pseudomonadota bacterium]